MKKVCLFLIVVLLLGCFAGCQEAPVETRSIENPDGTLSDWMKDKVAQDFERYYRDIYGQDAKSYSFIKWWEDGHLDGERYYGIYKDRLVFYLYNGVTQEGNYFYYVGSWCFVDKNGNWFALWAYKNGEFNPVKDLYDQGIFDDSTIEAILQTHNKFEYGTK